MFASSRNNMIKGMGIGLAVGTAAAIAGTQLMSPGTRRACKKGAAKCMRNVESMVNGIASMAK